MESLKPHYKTKNSIMIIIDLGVILFVGTPTHRRNGVAESSFDFDIISLLTPFLWTRKVSTETKKVNFLFHFLKVYSSNSTSRLIRYNHVLISVVIHKTNSSSKLWLQKEVCLFLHKPTHYIHYSWCGLQVELWNSLYTWTSVIGLSLEPLTS